jgi:hypothetical protein
MVRIISGLALSSTWGVMCEVGELPTSTLSIVVEHIRLLRFRLQGQKRASFKTAAMAAVLSKKIPGVFGMELNPSSQQAPSSQRESHSSTKDFKFAVFATISTHGERSPLPVHLRAAFRTVRVSERLEHVCPAAFSNLLGLDCQA